MRPHSSFCELKSDPLGVGQGIEIHQGEVFLFLAVSTKAHTHTNTHTCSLKKSNSDLESCKVNLEKFEKVRIHFGKKGPFYQRKIVRVQKQSASLASENEDLKKKLQTLETLLKEKENQASYPFMTFFAFFSCVFEKVIVVDAEKKKMEKANEDLLEVIKSLLSQFPSAFWRIFFFFHCQTASCIFHWFRTQYFLILGVFAGKEASH